MVVITPINAARPIDPGSAPSTARDDSVGRALQQVGGTIGQMGEAQQRLELRQQQRQMQTERFAADQGLRALGSEIDQEMATLQGRMPASGTGYVPAVNKMVKEKYASFGKSLPGWLRQEVEPQLAANAAVFESSAAKTEIAQAQTWYQQGIDKIIDSHAGSVFNDPTLLEAAIADVDYAIGQSGMYSVTAEEYRRKARIRLETEVASRGLRDDPAGVMAGLGVAGPEPMEGYFAAIRQAESGGDPTAKNPNSSAKGLYQFTAPTWEGLMSRYPSAKLTSEGRNDPVQQEVAIRLFTAENDKALFSAGVPVNNANRYAAHFLGSAGAIPVLRAPDGAALAGLVPTEVIKANPFLAGMTVRGFKDWAAGKVGGSKPAPSIAPQFADLPFDVRRELFDRAAAAGKAGIEIAVDNAPTAIQNTGSYSGRMPTPQDFVAVYGADAPARYQQFAASVEVAQQAYGMRTMSEADIAALVTSAAPTSSGTDAGLQQAKYDALSQAAATTIKARNEDPGTYVMRNFPEVADAWEGAQRQGADNSAYGKALAVSLAAQERLGVVSPILLPKKMATEAVNVWKNAERPELDRVDAVATLLGNAGTAEQQRAIFRQLVDEGLPEATAGAMDALVRGDQGAAQRLFRAALVDVSKLPGTSPEKPAVIDEAIQSGLMATGAIGDIYYGLSDGDALNLERAMQDASLIRNAVELRIRGGEPLNQAVQSVGRDLFGDVLPVQAPNVSVLVENGTDVQAAQTGFQQLLPRVRSVLEAKSALPPGVSAANSTRAIFVAAEKNEADRILAEGQFRNTADGFAFVDPRTGLAVEGPTGGPLVFTLDEVLAAAGSAPAPVDPVDAERIWLEQQAATFGMMGGSAQ